MKLARLMLLASVLGACAMSRNASEFKASSHAGQACLAVPYAQAVRRIGEGVEACWGESRMNADTLDVTHETGGDGGASFTVRHEPTGNIVAIYLLSRHEHDSACPTLLRVHVSSPLWGDTAGRARDFVDGKTDRLCR